MDQRMPEMEGTEAMKLIKSSKEGKNTETPIVCLTADVVSGARERYLEQGFDDYLTKPIESLELERMLGRLIPEELHEKTGEYDNPAGWHFENSAEHLAEESGISPENDPPAKAQIFEELEKLGVDTNTGIGFCGNDPQIYMSVLWSYAEEAEEKIRNLNENYALKNWGKYEIYSHSLKSTSKTIGAMELSKLAAVLENAANAQNKSHIDQNHDKVLSMYAQLVGIILNSADPDDFDGPGDDGEILEFAPE